MRIALTGASGLVGRWIAAAAGEAGHLVMPLSRPKWKLGESPDLSGCDALVHAAFQHVPGRYRGGEGDDPQGFSAANLDGSVRLFNAARDAGVRKVIFISSRAVHDGHPPGSLPDDMSPAPNSLYGKVKAGAEAALRRMAVPGFQTASLRPTGVCGPGQPQKWAGLIRGFLDGSPPEPRIATEVHGADLGRAAMLVLGAPDMSGSYNVSDLILDHHDLCAEIAALTGCRTPLPARSDGAALRIPDCARLQALGWRPGGLALLRRDLPAIVDDATGNTP